MSLRAAGHHVVWATGPDSQDHVRGFGFEAVAAGVGAAERRTPLAADQFENTVLVAEAGLGLVADSSARADEIAAAVQDALQQTSLRTAASAVADEIASMPPPEQYVEAIEGLLGAKNPPPERGVLL